VRLNKRLALAAIQNLMRCRGVQLGERDTQVRPPGNHIVRMQCSGPANALAFFRGSMVKFSSLSIFSTAVTRARPRVSASIERPRPIPCPARTRSNSRHGCQGHAMLDHCSVAACAEGRDLHVPLLRRLRLRKMLSNSLPVRSRNGPSRVLSTMSDG